jgi:hypothetical protein
VRLRRVCCEVGYWPGAATDGGSWKQVGCVYESIVTSSGIWFYCFVNFAFFLWYLNLYHLNLTLKLIKNKINLSLLVPKNAIF